jgi:T-complex protein 1 subunit eta
MHPGMRPPIILLRDGTDTSQGKGQLISNINACQAVGEVVRTTLGPRGMDKLVHDGREATISNDGATIMKLLDIVHPAAKTLVDISMSQDSEVGDGTTSVVLLACEFMRLSKDFIMDGMHPQLIIRGFREASLMAVKKLESIAIGVDAADKEARNNLLEKCAGTALNSKLICRNKDFFSPMCVQAVNLLDPNDMQLRNIGIKKVTGGSVTDSELVRGVAFKKTFSYAGFEQQQKSFDNPKVLCLNVELELKSEKENAEIRIDDPAKYQSIVDAEWKIIYDKLDACVKSGANVVLSRLPIGDLATQYFADRGMFCAGRVPNVDLKNVCTGTGAVVQTSLEDLAPKILGTCGRFEERQVGGERFNFFMDCPIARTATILLRGGAQQFLEESQRSIWDALNIVKRAAQSTRIVSGGGASEMEVMVHLRNHAMSIEGKQQLIIKAYSQAFEIVPRQLSENAGFDPTDILNKLRQKHFTDPNGRWFGVDMSKPDICDTMESNVWEPVNSKINAIMAATEAACLILSVDQTVKNPSSEQSQMAAKKQYGRQGGGGKPLSRAMGGKGIMGGAGMAGMKKMRGRGGR